MFSTPTESKGFSLFQNVQTCYAALSVPPSVFFPQGMKLATHIYLVPLLRMRGALLLLPLHAPTACTGTTLHLHVLYMLLC